MAARHIAGVVFLAGHEWFSGDGQAFAWQRDLEKSATMRRPLERKRRETQVSEASAQPR
ncbi:hypothetical protein ALSL_1298 [Aerosticca soli]|uniref:Uncharacterized protein n=1 Tax=Aerosticca soli TaxID=2010829 RepID=A0A2Z6E4D3_9GAMM|nr:hypothetical protein ALSL_1298 [Aerosticca soli]